MTLTIRPGGVDDVPAVLGLLDRAVEWLVANGRTGQWGTEPATGNPGRHAQALAWARSGGLYLADIDGVVAGALAVGQATPEIPAAPEPELYINLLVTDRDRAGSGIGTALLDRAREVAREQGVSLLRVDCYAGDDRALVRYYESQGFTPTEAFSVGVRDGVWPGQVLAQRL